MEEKEETPENSEGVRETGLGHWIELWSEWLAEAEDTYSMAEELIEGGCDELANRLLRELQETEPRYEEG